MKRLATFLLLAICFSGSIAGSEVKRPRVLGLSHMALFVSDLGKARALYEDFLGYQEPYVLKREDGSDQIIFIKINELRPARKGYARPIEVKVGKNGKRQVNLFDPDGTRIELMEPNTADVKVVPSSTAPPPDNKS